MACDRHEDLVDELKRVKNSQSELYQLDRNKAETMAEIREDVATLKADSKHTKEKVDSLCDEVGEIKESIGKIKTAVENKKWSPKDYIALVSTILSSSVICIIISTILGAK